MYNIPMKLLLSGAPGVGKTTLVKEIILFSPQRFSGFITEEIRDEKGNRIGFSVADLSGNKRTFARVGFSSSFRVGKYGVDIMAFEELVLPVVEGAIGKGKIIVIDEIGKMELFSEKFKRLISHIFSMDEHIFATIKQGYDTFTEALKRRDDVLVYVLTRANYNEVKRSIVEALGLRV